MHEERRMMRLVAAATAAIVIAASAAGAFDLQGHRGARGLAPENTLEGFARALSIGVSTLELDLGMSKDGAVVVQHDIWLNPDTTRGPDGLFLAQRGPALRALTLAELQRYDVGRLKPGTSYAASFPEQQPIDGARIPTLAAVFDLARRAKADHVRFNIETKMTPSARMDVADPETFASTVIRAVRDAGLAARVSVQSFDWSTLAMFRRLAPEITRVCLTVERGANNNIQRGQPGPSPWTAGLDVDDFGGSTPRLVKAADCAGWSPMFLDLTDGTLKEAKALGLKVIPWTVNEPADMDRLIAAGVDGLITDYPDRLRAVLAAKKLPLPPAASVP
jgi:glycerophosphoryl diester phosphodiesterase